MYQAAEERYQKMDYVYCGKSGLKLPEVSLGFWHNFGDTGVYENMKQICFTAFDNGITHFDLANNYGPEPGSAEKNFGRILKEEMGQHRDEMVISTNVGWPLRGLGKQKVSAGKPGSEPAENGTGLCRHLLSSQDGSEYTIRGDHGCIGYSSTVWKSTLCRTVQL